MCLEYRGVRIPEASAYISGSCGNKYSARDGSFSCSGYTMAGSGLLRRQLMPSQRLNTVACNVESSDLAVRVSILAE